MKIGRPIAFVVLAFMIGAIISQGSFAFADDSATNPFRAIWEAIGELQTRTDSLQAQIDDIKTNGVAASEEQPAAKVSETSLAIDIGSGDAGQTVIDIVATNAGPESAVGVKVLTYYQMSLLDVYFIDGAQCTDQARGIIECYVGTIESGGAAQITIDATPLQLFGTDYPTPDGTAIRDYVHVDDLAEAHVLALAHLERGGSSEILNLGSGVGSSVREVVAAAERVTGRTVPLVERPRRAGDPVAVYADNSRAAMVLGWSPTRSLDDIIASAWRWHSLHPQGFRGSA